MEAAKNQSPEIVIMLPDGATRTFPRGTTGMEIAENISKSLAKAVVAVKIDGVLSDLSLPIEDNAKIALVKRIAECVWK